MRKVVVGILFLFAVSIAHAQMNSGVFYLGLNTFKPLSDKDFIERTSSAGMKFGFTKRTNDVLGFGLEIGYNTLHEYIPRQTYEYPGGAITTDIHNYIYYFTIMGNAHYYFLQGEKFMPYTSLGMGIAFSEYRMFYNVFQDSDGNQAFVVRPEVGTLFRLKAYSHWGLKASVSYDYTTNKSEYFETDNLTGISLLLGVVIYSN